jgi:predicted nuclease of restriction endonuclease-like (RecB) superfamily
MEEQHGASRAEYGKEIIRTLSVELTDEYGRGFSATNLINFRKFYDLFREFQIPQTASDEFPRRRRLRLPKSTGKKPRKKIHQTASDESAKLSLPPLSWSHYERLLRVETAAARCARWWYMREAVEQMWSVRALDRNINTQYYERLLLSPTKNAVMREMRQKTAPLPLDQWSLLKNPTVMEFLGLPPERGYTERDLEKKIIDHLQNFIMELGKGFAFIARQQLIRTEADDYYLDLVFYNYLLKCFVLIDLKNR